MFLNGQQLFGYMTIDTTLTTESALESIGEVVRIQYRMKNGSRTRWGPRNNHTVYCKGEDSPKCGFERRMHYYDMMWTLDHDSQLVTVTEQWRRTPKPIRPINEETEEYIEKYSQWVKVCGLLSVQLPRIGFIGYPHGYFSQMAKERYGDQTDYIMFHQRKLLFRTLPITYIADEMLLNAIEHGTDYCRKGKVTTRFVGGQFGCLFFIDQPGEGFAIRQLSKEEAQKIHQRDDICETNKMYCVSNETARGMGLAQASEEECPIVNAMPYDGKFRTIVLYNLDDLERITKASNERQETAK